MVINVEKEEGQHKKLQKQRTETKYFDVCGSGVCSMHLDSLLGEAGLPLGMRLEACRGMVAMSDARQGAVVGGPRRVRAAAPVWQGAAGRSSDKAGGQRAGASEAVDGEAAGEQAYVVAAAARLDVARLHPGVALMGRRWAGD